VPDPEGFDNESDWMEACMSTATEEGKDNDQAVAMCMRMWADKPVKGGAS